MICYEGVPNLANTPRDRNGESSRQRGSGDASASGQRDSGDASASGQKGKGDAKASPHRPHWTQYGIFWATLAAFLGVCAYTYYAREQVSKSQTANAIAKQAFAEANRPYVLVSGFPPTRVTSGKNTLAARIGVQWTNYGNTPAYAVVPTFCDPIVRHDLVTPNFTCHVSDSVVPQFVIGPKQATNIVGPVIADADLLGTRDESTAVYLFGKTDYVDGVDVDEFGRQISRVTWFCSRIVLPQPRSSQPPYDPIPTPIEGTVPVSFGCATLNCADDACRAQSLPTVSR
jgi:hypothetical protein